MKYEYLVISDHFQFYVADEDYTTDTNEIWTEEAFDINVACGNDLVAVGTARYGGETKVVIEIVETPLNFDQEDISPATYCKLQLSSGSLMLFAPESDYEKAPKISIEPGLYIVAVFFKNLDSVHDELQMSGDDVYHLIFWPDQ